jgi:hypothetical protein
MEAISDMNADPRFPVMNKSCWPLPGPPVAGSPVKLRRIVLRAAAVTGAELDRTHTRGYAIDREDSSLRETADSIGRSVPPSLAGSLFRGEGATAHDVSGSGDGGKRSCQRRREASSG